MNQQPLYNPDSFYELPNDMQHTKYGCNVTKDFLKKILNYDYLDSSHIIFYQNLFKDMVKNERVWAFNSHFFEDVTPCLSIQIDLNDMELPKQTANRSGGGPGSDNEQKQKDDEMKKSEREIEDQNKEQTEASVQQQLGQSNQQVQEKQSEINNTLQPSKKENHSAIIPSSDNLVETNNNDSQPNKEEQEGQNIAQPQQQLKDDQASQIKTVSSVNSNINCPAKCPQETEKHTQLVIDGDKSVKKQEQFEESDLQMKKEKEEQQKKRERDAEEKRRQDQIRKNKEIEQQNRRKKEEEEKERQKQEEMAKKFSIKIGPIRVVEQEKGKIRWQKATEYLNNVKQSIKVSSLEEIQTKLDFIFFPINLDNSHWVSACIDVKNKQIKHFDSLGGSPNRLIHNTLFTIAIRDLNISVGDFKTEAKNESNCQQNNYDCGIFVLLSLLKIMNAIPDYNQAFVSKFRSDKLYRLAIRAIFDDLNKTEFYKILND